MTGTRRSRRRVLFLPLRVIWRHPNGQQIKEYATTEDVSEHGAVLRMKQRPPISVEIELVNRLTDRTSKARVVRVRPARNGQERIAVELLAPSSSFWASSNSRPGLHHKRIKRRKRRPSLWVIES